MKALLETGAHFAPPVLRHGDVEISQLPNIMLYLGQKLGLVGSEENHLYMVNGLTLTILDLCNEVHDSHHPIAVMLYYEDQKEAALARAAI